MATQNLLGEFCEETTCSICLEYFKEPVILDCGHNFCQACLTQCWGESDRAPACPQCRAVSQQKNFRPNRQLANLVELVKKLEVGKRAVGRKWEVCEQHLEAMKLFCKEDQTRICWLCERSKEHKNHNTVLLDEAAQEYKERIKTQQGSLEKEKDRLVVWKLAEEQGSQRCLTQVRMMMKETKYTFEQMRLFLEEKECLRLSQLRDLEKEMEDRHEESVRRLSEEISHLCSLIAEMEGKCQQPADEFLQDIKSTWSRYEQKPVRRAERLFPKLEMKLRNWSLKISALEKVMEDYKASLDQAVNKEFPEEVQKKGLLCKGRSHEKTRMLWKERGLSWKGFLPKDQDVIKFISEQKMGYTKGDSSNVPSRKELTSEELCKQLDKLLKENVNNQRIYDWIQANLSEQQISSNVFVRALMTSVCHSAIDLGDLYCVDRLVIKSRAKLLQKYMSDEHKELQALYALQALIVKLDQPPNLLHMFFDALYNEDVINDDAFYKWESSKDPAEQQGKGVALRSVTAFYTWLRELEEESEN